MELTGYYYDNLGFDYSQDLGNLVLIGRGTVKEQLLDELATQVGCRCLSELREPLYRSALLGALSNLDVDSFSIRQWEDAANYLLGQDGRMKPLPCLRDGTQVQSFLMAQLSGQ